MGTLSNTAEFIRKARQKHADHYDYSHSVYKRALDKVTITCPIHGDFIQTAASHLFGRGCKKCAATSSTEDFVRKSKEFHGDKYDYSLTKVDGCQNKVQIICRKHGIFEQSTSNHMNGAGCRKCRSNISRMCDEWLDSLGLPDDNSHREVILPIKIGRRHYIADGYDSVTKTVYEFWGDFWHGNPAKYSAEVLNNVVKKTMGDLYEQKMLKTTKILEAGYRLHEIWETEWIARNK